MYSFSYDEQAAREAAWDDGRIEGEAIGEARGETKGIKAAIAMAKDFSISQSQVIEQLMRRFDLTHDQAAAAVQANW